MHFVPSLTSECALDSFIINKYINTSVATVAIKGEFQAYMMRTTAEEKGTKDVTGAQWQRQGDRDNTMCVKYWKSVHQIPLVLFAISVWIMYFFGVWGSFMHYRPTVHGVGTSCWPVLICCCCWAPEAEDEAELEERILVLGSLCSFFHFILRFWNQILTWRSDRHMVCAISTRLRRVR